MTFDITAALDPEIAAVLPDGPVGNFGSLTLDRIPAARAASGGLQMPPAPPTTVTRIVELPPGTDGFGCRSGSTRRWTRAATVPACCGSTAGATSSARA